MFELFVKFSRYLFVLYILVFLWQGMLFVMDENGQTSRKHPYTISVGKSVTALMHITAFLILSYDKSAGVFQINTLLIGAYGLVFMALFYFFTKRMYKNSCLLLWNIMMFLMDIGMIMIGRLNLALAQRQLVWMSVGLFVMLWIPFVIRMIPRFELLEPLYMVLSFVLILGTLLLGSEEYGSKNWIYIGPFSFQPAEMVKFLFIFYLASVFRKRVEMKQLIITGVLSGILVLLLVLQRDLGSALIFFMTYMVMLYIATANELLFLLGMGAASIASVIGYYLFSHVRVRVAIWQNPWSDVDGTGYQIVQSLFAIGCGGFLGSGLTLGMPTSIPVVTKDFIFAAICEEFGAIFGIGLIVVFILFIYRGMRIALCCERRYYSLLASGITSLLAFQTFLIIGGVIKLIPLTGVTLPFVSYGGTSMFISILMAGLLQWISSYEALNGRGLKDE